MHQNSHAQLYLLRQRLDAQRAESAHDRHLRAYRAQRAHWGLSLRARLAAALHALAARLEPRAPQPANDAELPLR